MRGLAAGLLRHTRTNRPVIKPHQSLAMPSVLWSALDPRTENSSVMPGQRLRPPTPKNDSTAYDSSVPTGVDALNMAKCRLQSATGRSVATRDVVSASAVGAANDNDSQPPPYAPCAESDVAQHTFVDRERQEDNYR